MSSMAPHEAISLDLDPRTALLMTRFSRRRKRLLLVRAVAAGLLFLVSSMVMVALCDYLWVLSDPVRWILSLIAYTITVIAIWWFGIRQWGNDDPRMVARQLEAVDDGMREDLLSAVELADPSDANGSAGFRQRLQKSVARHASSVDIGRVLPVDLIIRWLVSGLVIFLVFSSLLFVPRIQFGRRIARALLPGAAIERASLTNVEILKPSPPSGFVAEGDAVGVTVQVGGSQQEDVWLQWRTSEAEGETRMTPRVVTSASHSDGTLGHEGVFAANVSVGSIPLEYRVIAGDAITLWHDLTPLPRPRVVAFNKRYVFPEYAALPDRTEEAEHGDLKALVGTMAFVTVEFDQAVSEAFLKYGNQGATVELDAVDGSDRKFVASIPIRTSTTYQIDATSAESGLNNPFSSQYTIAPIVDIPPTADWGAQVPSSRIVSPLQIVSLQATAIDDLPMERLIHEFQVNDEDVLRLPMDIEAPGRELDVRWDWDLMDRLRDDQPSTPLRSGDIVRMRMVAIDRKGQRGESPFIELLIAEEGFDADRHFRLKEVRRWSESVTDWINRSRELMNLMKLSAEKSDWLTIQEQGDEAIALIDEYATIETATLSTLAGSRFEQEATTIELVGRALIDHQLKLLDWFDEAELERGSEKPRELINQAKQLTADGARIDQLTRSTVAEYLTAAIVSDAKSLDRSLEPLVGTENALPPDRFPRYLLVTMGRMEEIDRLIGELASVLPESTRRHLEVWERMSGQWQSRFASRLKNDPGRVNADMVREFQIQLRSMADRSMVDGRLAPSIVNLTRDIRFQVRGTGDRIFALDRAGRVIKSSRLKAAESNDSAEVAEFNQQMQKAMARYDRVRDALLERLSGEERLHRRRPRVDLQYAADLDLIRRAIENVTAEGFQSYNGESPEQVHQKLARAFQVIEATHESTEWLREIQALLLVERKLAENSTTKILHPNWIERFSTGLDWPTRTLQNVGLSPVAEKIDRVRYGEIYNEARARITQRRWTDDPMLSAETSLDKLQSDMSDALKSLGIPVLEARETIQQYVLDLSEQAREAAKEAREAEDADRSREDSKTETLEALQEQNEKAIESAEQTVEALIDYANTIDVTDAEQRELARDADAAAAQIQADLNRAEQAMKQADQAASESDRGESIEQTADAMRDLAESLEQTAAHFERADAGEDIDESRQELREAEAALEMQQQMQQPYDQTEDLAEATQRTPEELLEELEKELQSNEPMQQELSDIAEYAAENAARTLENSARQERELNQALQRSDGSFQEQKRQLADMIKNVAQRTATIDASLLQATQNVSNLAAAPEWRKDIQEARDELNAATQRANQMGGENALLSDMQEAARDLSDATDKAAEILSEVNRKAKDAQSEDLHQDESNRKRASDQSQRFMRDARSTQLRASNQEIQQWSSAKRDASRRVQMAQRQKRDAGNRQRQIEDQVKQDPERAKSLEPQLNAAQQRVEEAERKETSARESVDFIDRQLDAAKQRGSELKKRSIPKLEQSNPGAESAASLTEQAANELRGIKNDLNELVEKTQIDEQIRLPSDQAKSLANQQSRIADEVQEAVEQLRRAARHEERLGREPMAEKLDAVADAVKQQAGEAARAAKAAIQQAAENRQATPQADAQVAEAAEMIQQAADQVGNLLEDVATSSESGPLSTENETAGSAEEERMGQQLARALDELDRALNAPASQSAQEGQAGEGKSAKGEQSSQGEPQSSQGESTSGESTSSENSASQGENATGNQQAPGEQGSPSSGSPETSNQSQPGTAGEASQTLAEALAQQAQEAARQRGQQLRGESQSGSQASSQGPNSPSSSAGNEPGSGDIPDGGALNAVDVERLGAAWGQLRQQRTEDASESQGATIAPQYRREIEAYFRAVARQAAASQAKESQSNGSKE